MCAALQSTYAKCMSMPMITAGVFIAAWLCANHDDTHLNAPRALFAAST
jgi:hypothetical protein